MEDVRVVHGDSLEVLAGLEAESVDAVVTDPPYGLEFMGKAWDKLDAGLPQESVWKGRRGQGGGSIGDDRSKPGSRHRTSFGMKPAGFKRCRACGKRAFSGSPCECVEPDWVVEYAQRAPSGAVRAQRWHEAWARAVYRVAKPGAHLLAFGGTRTYHRLACALEDAGWEIRDSLVWVYGTGFPKSHNVSKALAKGDPDAAAEWEGWGTALKPAHEPIVLARKPLDGTVARSVAERGTGSLNVDGCRVAAAVGDRDEYWLDDNEAAGIGFKGLLGRAPYERHAAGRWPPNLLLSHAACCGEGCGPCCPVREMDAQSGASRFFPRFRYVAKASRKERNAGLGDLPVQVKAQNQGAVNVHPTVKPVALMQWLVRLVTPPGGLVLDPFAGSGTTGVAARREGFRFLGVEREEEYARIAEARIAAEML